MLVYIASSLLNIERVKRLQSRFQQHGVRISYDWTSHGQVFTPEELRKYGEAEKGGVEACDLLFFVQPARNGSHVELGIALALGKPIVILEEQPVEQKTFYYLTDVAKFTSEDEAITYSLGRIMSRYERVQQDGNRCDAG